MLERGPASLFWRWFACRLAGSGPGQPPVVRLAVISEGYNTWPLYVALDKQLFSKEGVSVQVTLTRSSAKQLDALKSGDFDIGFQQCDHVVRAVENGSDLFMFMALAPAPELSLVVAPGIRSFADLKGAEIAVDGARSGYALLLRKLLGDQGLAAADYVLREIGGSRERYEALKSGTCAASLLNAPFDSNLFAAGFGTLGTTADYYPTYTGSIAAARRSWAAQNASALLAFIRGMNAAFTWLQDARHRAEAVAILRGRLDVSPEAAAAAFEGFGKRPVPQIREDGLRQVIDVVWEAEALQAPKGGPEKYMDLGYFARATGAS